MSWSKKEPTKDELLEGAYESLKYYEKELVNAKSYWYKLQMKKEILRCKKWIQELKQDD